MFPIIYRSFGPLTCHVINKFDGMRLKKAKTKSERKAREESKKKFFDPFVK